MRTLALSQTAKMDSYASFSHTSFEILKRWVAFHTRIFITHYGIWRVRQVYSCCCSLQCQVTPGQPTQEQNNITLCPLYTTIQGGPPHRLPRKGGEACVCAHVSTMEVLSWKKNRQATKIVSIENTLNQEEFCTAWKTILLTLMPFCENSLSSILWKTLFELPLPLFLLPPSFPSLSRWAWIWANRHMARAATPDPGESSPFNSLNCRPTLNLNQCVCWL